MQIDVNCDMGEIAGAHDEALMDFVTSVNIACGFHAGDEASMRQTAKLALKQHLAIGAHPSFLDRENFGRSPIVLPPEEIFNITVQQIQDLKSIVESEGGKLNHVKPHGALYNMAAKDPTISEAIAKAILHVDPNLIFFGLTGSEMIKAGKKLGLRTAQEIFADRTYRSDGSLTPRSEPDAFVTDPKLAAENVVQTLSENRIKADTVCLHGDGANALEFARAFNHRLKKNNILIKKLA